MKATPQGGACGRQPENTTAMLAEACFQIDRLLGSPDDPRVPGDDVLLAGQNPQISHTLAYLYSRELPGNRWQGHPVLLQLVERLKAHTLVEEPLPRRLIHPLMHAFRLVRGDLGDKAGQWKEDLARFVRKRLMPVLEDRDRITALSSANVGYGTNHLAVELSGLTGYIKAFGDDPEFSQMDPGGPELVAFARAFLTRFVDYMHPDGYWVECDGPAISYNTLTGQALYACARDLGTVEEHRSAFETASQFHCATTLPVEPTPF